MRRALIAGLLGLVASSAAWASGELPTYSVSDMVAPSSSASFTGGTVANATTFSQQLTANQNTILGSNPNNFVTLDGNTIVRGLADGSIQVTKLDGSVVSLYLGPTTSSGTKLLPGGNGSLTVANGVGSQSSFFASQIQTSSFVLGNTGNGAASAFWMGSGSSGVQMTRHPTDAANVYVTSDNNGGTGFLNLAQYTVAKTANYTLLQTDNGTHFTNDGASGAITLTLPTARKGLRYIITVTAAQVLNVTGAAGTLNAPGNLAKTTAAMDGSTAKMSSFEILCWDGTNWQIRAMLGSTITYS